jgi:multiple sugar transport system substrate-binding protein
VRSSSNSGVKAVGWLAVALCALAVGACGGGSSGGGGDSAKKTTITFSYLWTGKEAQAVQSLIREFNASQSAIVVKGVSNPDAQAQLAAMTSSKGRFDVSDNFGSNVGSWASKGILTPLDSYMKADGYSTGDFVPAAMAGMRYQGQTYSLPVAVHSFQLLYNKDLLAKAGIKDPPKTTSEWAAAIRATTKRKGDGLSQLGFAGPTPAGPDLTTMAFAFGGAWFDGSGKPTPQNPGNLAAAQFYLDNVPRAYGAKAVQKFTSGFGEYASPQNPFFQGKLAMVVDGEWMSAFVKQFAPKLNWGVAPLPYPDDRPELAGSTQLTASTLFIPRNSQHKEQAWKFIRFMLDKKPMESFTHTLANLPARQSLLDSGAYDDLPEFNAFLESLKSKNLHALDSGPGTQEYTTNLAKAFDAIARTTKSPQQALGDVAAKAKDSG